MAIQARTKHGAIIFFDEIDATGGTRSDSDVFGNNEVQRTILEIVNQIDDACGNIEVSRSDTDDYTKYSLDDVLLKYDGVNIYIGVCDQPFKLVSGATISMKASKLQGNVGNKHNANWTETRMSADIDIAV